MLNFEDFVVSQEKEISNELFGFFRRGQNNKDRDENLNKHTGKYKTSNMHGAEEEPTSHSTMPPPSKKNDYHFYKKLHDRHYHENSNFAKEEVEQNKNFLEQRRKSFKERYGEDPEDILRKEQKFVIVKDPISGRDIKVTNVKEFIEKNEKHLQSFLNSRETPTPAHIEEIKRQMRIFDDNIYALHSHLKYLSPGDHVEKKAIEQAINDADIFEKQLKNRLERVIESEKSLRPQNDKIQRLQNSVNARDDEIKRLHQKDKGTTDYIRRLYGANSRLLSERDRLHTERSRLMGQVSDKDYDLRRAKEENDSIRKEIEDKDRAIKSLQEQLEKVKRESDEGSSHSQSIIRELEEKIRDHVEERDTLKRTLKEALKKGREGVWKGVVAGGVTGLAGGLGLDLAYRHGHNS